MSMQQSHVFTYRVNVHSCRTEHTGGARQTDLGKKFGRLAGQSPASD